MSDKVRAKEVSQDNIDNVMAWHKDPDWAAREEAPAHLGVKAEYDIAANAIVLEEPVRCNGNIITKLEL